ncbi:hypothetical protein [Aquimarina agarilytica]|uniref:hypothetical protein n=1 Tax=Aquimarina agarilytica TaxID=1087449 RepID=UPI001E2EAC95|nr:hypothetical protein [Aquimarina agarilytica]
MGNASPRTIARHLKRLQEAGFITNKIWHGSNSSYELFINSNILWENLKKAVNNPKNVAKGEENLAADNQNFKEEHRTICPHTDTSNNSYTTNILIAVDKLSKKMSSLPLTVGKESRNVTGNKDTGYTEEKCPEKNDTSNKTGDKKNEDFLAGDKVSTEDAEGNAQKKRVTSHTSGEKSSEDVALSASRSTFALKLWQYAENVLYKDYHLTEYQKTRAREHLEKWYAPFDSEKELLRIHQVYLDRIGLVQKYIAKDPENRYASLPDKYFDLENPYGFKGTREWYFKQKVREEEVRLQLILKHQIRKFERNEKQPEHKKQSSLEVFRQCETRLGELGKPELLQAFHASVLQSQSYQFSH